MSLSGSSSHEQLTKADQIALKFFNKVALLVHHARTTPLQPLNKVEKWFNLETPDTDRFRSDLLPYRSLASSTHSHPPPPFELQVLLSVPELLTNQVLVLADPTAQRVRIDPTPSYVLLESWLVAFHPERTSDETQQLSAVYKQSISVFRSLFTLLKLLPAWKLCRKLRRPDGSKLAIEVRVRRENQHEASVLKFGAPLSSSAASPLPTASHAFSPVLYPSGTISITSTYLVSPLFQIDTLESLLSSRFLSQEDEGFTPTLAARQSNNTPPTARSPPPPAGSSGPSIAERFVLSATPSPPVQGARSRPSSLIQSSGVGAGSATGRASPRDVYPPYSHPYSHPHPPHGTSPASPSPSSAHGQGSPYGSQPLSPSGANQGQAQALPIRRPSLITTINPFKAPTLSSTPHSHSHSYPSQHSQHSGSSLRHSPLSISSGVGLWLPERPPASPTAAGRAGSSPSSRVGSGAAYAQSPSQLSQPLAQATYPPSPITTSASRPPSLLGATAAAGPANAMSSSSSPSRPSPSPVPPISNLGSARPSPPAPAPSGSGGSPSSIGAGGGGGGRRFSSTFEHRYRKDSSGSGMGTATGAGAVPGSGVGRSGSGSGSGSGISGAVAGGSAASGSGSGGLGLAIGPAGMSAVAHDKEHVEDPNPNRPPSTSSLPYKQPPTPPARPSSSSAFVRPDSDDEELSLFVQDIDARLGRGRSKHGLGVVNVRETDVEGERKRRAEASEGTMTVVAPSRRASMHDNEEDDQDDDAGGRGVLQRQDQDGDRNTNTRSNTGDAPGTGPRSQRSLTRRTRSSSSTAAAIRTRSGRTISPPSQGAVVTIADVTWPRVVSPSGEEEVEEERDPPSSRGSRSPSNPLGRGVGRTAAAGVGRERGLVHEDEDATVTYSPSSGAATAARRAETSGTYNTSPTATTPVVSPSSPPRATTVQPFSSPRAGPADSSSPGSRRYRDHIDAELRRMNNEFTMSLVGLGAGVNASDGDGDGNGGAGTNSGSASAEQSRGSSSGKRRVLSTAAAPDAGAPRAREGVEGGNGAGTAGFGYDRTMSRRAGTDSPTLGTTSSTTVLPFAPGLGLLPSSLSGSPRSGAEGGGGGYPSVPVYGGHHSPAHRRLSSETHVHPFLSKRLSSDREHVSSFPSNNNNSSSSGNNNSYGSSHRHYPHPHPHSGSPSPSTVTSVPYHPPSSSGFSPTQPYSHSPRSPTQPSHSSQPHTRVPSFSSRTRPYPPQSSPLRTPLTLDDDSPIEAEESAVVSGSASGESSGLDSGLGARGGAGVLGVTGVARAAARGAGDEVLAGGASGAGIPTHPIPTRATIRHGQSSSRGVILPPTIYHHRSGSAASVRSDEVIGRLDWGDDATAAATGTGLGLERRSSGRGAGERGGREGGAR